MTLKRLIFASLLTLAASSAWAAPVSLTAADGVQLSAEVEGEGVNGVLLVHHKGRTRADWGPFVRKLADKGFHVVALDLRGHGASPGDKPADDGYVAMTADVQAGVDYLRQSGATRVAIIGAELGANLATNVAAEDAEISNLILLSAGMNIAGVKSGSALEQYGNRPVLIVASEEETYANRSAAYLEGKAQGEKHVEILNGAGSGTKMLTRDPNLEGMVLSWLNGTFFMTKEGSGSTAGTQKQLTTGDTTGIETTGQQFGERTDEEPTTLEAPMPELNLDE